MALAENILQEANTVRFYEREHAILQLVMQGKAGTNDQRNILRRIIIQCDNELKAQSASVVRTALTKLGSNYGIILAAPIKETKLGRFCDTPHSGQRQPKPKQPKK